MHTLEVTDDQLRMLHEAMNSWINSFSHDQPDILHDSKELRRVIELELHETKTSTMPGGRPRFGSL
ncbi:MAG: hypothetical protein ABI200_04115 [Gaiellales bacterium]